MLGLLLALAAHSQAWASQATGGAPDRQAQVQRLTDRLRMRLSIPQDVIVAIVDLDPLVASVRPARDREDAFVISSQRGFLASLTDEELEAVLAHELGHVWIYTHHPYLQTEQLANRIAMRLVALESLERLYRKLWGAGSLTVSLSGFLGLPAGG